MEQELPIRRSPEEESGVELESVSSDLMHEIEEDPASDIYQFVMVASALGTDSASENGRVGDVERRPALLSQLWDRVDELEKLVRDGARYVTKLETTISELEHRAERAHELEGVITERMAQLHARDRELKQLRLTLALKERQMVDIQGRLATAAAELEAAAAMRDRCIELERQNDEMTKRLGHARYRAADWMSRLFKSIPGFTASRS